MHRKLSLVELAGCLLDALRVRLPGVRCYDAVPRDAPAPLVFAEITGKEDASTKTMYIERFTVHLHAITAQTAARTEIYTLVQQVEEAMSEGIPAPRFARLLRQTENGIQGIERDDTGEWHAVLSYELTFSYGYRVKTI